MSGRGHYARCDYCFSAVVNRSWKKSQYERCKSLNLGSFVKEVVVLGKNDMGDPKCRTYVIGHGFSEQVDPSDICSPVGRFLGPRIMSDVGIGARIASVTELSFGEWV